MAPVQRAGIEYEFTVTADLDWEHTLLIDKTRCHPLAGRMMKMGHTKELGETLATWLGSAEALATQAQIEDLRATLNAGSGELRAEFRRRFGLPQHLTAKPMAEAQAWLDSQQNAGQVAVDPAPEIDGGVDPKPPPGSAPPPDTLPPEPEFDVDVDSDDVYDGDVPDDEVPADSPAGGGGPMTESQSRRLHALLREKRGAVGPQRFIVLAAIVGRPIQSSKDLTSEEAFTAIRTLDAEPTPEATAAATLEGAA